MKTDLNREFKISAFDKLSVITLPLLLRAEIPKVSCFGTSHISRMACCSLILGHSAECHSHKPFPHPVVHVLPFVQCPSTSSIPDFFAFLKRIPFFLISLLKFLFIHGRLCREFDNFDGMLTARIPSMYSIKTV